MVVVDTRGRGGSYRETSDGSTCVHVVAAVNAREVEGWGVAGKLTAVVISTREGVEGWICRRVCNVVVVNAREGGVGDRNAREK